MATRTMVGHRLTFHVWQHPDEKRPPSNLDGINLADYMYGWCNERLRIPMVDESTQNWTRIEKAEQHGRNVVIVNVCSGKWGERGPVVNSASGEVGYNLEEKDVPAAYTRGVLMCPPAGNTALFFSEYNNRGSGAVQLLRAFITDWRRSGTGFTIDSDRIIESEAFLQSGSVTAVEVHQLYRTHDPADPLSDKPGYIVHAFRSGRGSALPIVKYFQIKDNPSRACEIVSIPERDLDDSSIVYVTVKVGGRQKRIQVGDPDDSIYYREVLNEWNESNLTDDEILERCNVKAIEYLDRLGEEWLPIWME